MFVMGMGPYITTGPQSASGIGTPRTPQITSILVTGVLKPGSPHFASTQPLVNELTG